ncbi:myb-related transcription factor, partner of profilin-like [Acipenser ruthenus]|uniref:myb-related transcription factor, partner of profilin-like n=1 Tax=Acipenser ruthenus TaxID=7906 RepID=UPI00274125B6|nr:myb-related transcription factor, partner of profilin-like [Acipenser ruthenus]
MEAAHISPELPVRWVVSADRTVEIKEEVTELGCDQTNERILQEETPPSSITEKESKTGHFQSAKAEETDVACLGSKSKAAQNSSCRPITAYAPDLPKEAETGRTLPKTNEVQKKTRVRFSREDEDIIMAEVEERWDELFGVRSLSLARGAKARIWQDIATRVSASSSGVRDGEDIRKKWTYSKQSLRTKVAAQRTSPAQAGGGVNTTPELTPLEQRLLALMGHECVGGVDAPDVGFGPEPPLEESSGTLPQTEDSDTISNEGSHEHQQEPTVPSTAASTASTSRCRGPPPGDDLAPILASILDRQEQTLTMHREAIGILRSLAADVHRYVDHVISTPVPTHVPAPMMSSNISVASKCTPSPVHCTPHTPSLTTPQTSSSHFQQPHTSTYQLPPQHPPPAYRPSPPPVCRLSPHAPQSAPLDLYTHTPPRTLPVPSPAPVRLVQGCQEDTAPLPQTSAQEPLPPPEVMPSRRGRGRGRGRARTRGRGRRWR